MLSVLLCMMWSASVFCGEKCICSIETFCRFAWLMFYSSSIASFGLHIKFTHKLIDLSYQKKKNQLIQFALMFNFILLQNKIRFCFIPSHKKKITQKFPQKLDLTFKWFIFFSILASFRMFNLRIKYA